MPLNLRHMNSRCYYKTMRMNWKKAAIEDGHEMSAQLQILRMRAILPRPESRWETCRTLWHRRLEGWQLWPLALGTVLRSCRSVCRCTLYRLCFGRRVAPTRIYVDTGRCHTWARDAFDDWLSFPSITLAGPVPELTTHTTRICVPRTSAASTSPASSTTRRPCLNHLSKGWR